MNDKLQLIRALIDYRVLQFGEFKTKSGRISPIFFNTGNFCSGGSLGIFADQFAHLIAEHFNTDQLYLYGPAYKGISLAVLVADRLQKLSGNEVFFTFNRKEKKDHGEGNELIGYRYSGGEQVIIVEDVLTAGTSIRESIALLRSYGVSIRGAVIGIDRQEKGVGTKLARQELMDEFDIPLYCLLSAQEILQMMPESAIMAVPAPERGALLERLQEYRQRYGL